MADSSASVLSRKVAYKISLAIFRKELPTQDTWPVSTVSELPGAAAHLCSRRC